MALDLLESPTSPLHNWDSVRCDVGLFNKSRIPVVEDVGQEQDGKEGNTIMHLAS